MIGVSQLVGVARVGYEAMIEATGYSSTGEHAWENQSIECQAAWVKAARAILEAAAVSGREADALPR